MCWVPWWIRDQPKSEIWWLMIDQWMVHGVRNSGSFSSNMLGGFLAKIGEIVVEWLRSWPSLYYKLSGDLSIMGFSWSNSHQMNIHGPTSTMVMLMWLLHTRLSNPIRILLDGWVFHGKSSKSQPKMNDNWRYHHRSLFAIWSVDPLGLDPLPFKSKKQILEVHVSLWYHQEAVMKQKKLRAWTFFSYQSNAIFSG